MACGSVLEAALAPYLGKRTGENVLLRGLERGLEPDDVLLTDRYFSGYFDIAWWREREVDVVTRRHQRRCCDLRRGLRLGPNDHLVIWSKPTQRPQWMDAATYQSVPEELCVGEVRVHIRQRGFRTKQVVVVTTLLDHEEYSAHDLADLYRVR